MKKLVTLFAFALLAFTTNAQSTLKGNVNGDGEVNVTDVTMIVEYVLGQHNSSFIVTNADINGDGGITVTDVAEAVNIILEGNGGNNNGSGDGSGIGDTSQAYLTCPNGHHPHMIDLGLPSGTKWACCNVGANIPEGYGGYYAWGEVQEKNFYSWGTYQYWTDNDGDGYVDSNEVTNLESDIAGTQYDVAHVQWSGSWVMPSLAQILELTEKCTYIWTSMNGVYGGLFTGPNGGTIFLPAAGHRWTERLSGAGSSGYYWYSRRDTSNSNYAYDLVFSSGNAYVNSADYRYYGHTVRPIWVP